MPEEHEATNHTLNHFLKLTKEKNVCKNLNGGHLERIKPSVHAPIQNLLEHLKQKAQQDSSFGPGIGTHGGSVGSGGSYGSGGSLHMGGALNLSWTPKNPKEAYHWSLNLTPQQLEMKREIAAQLLGGVASPMWGKLVSKEDKLEADPEEYEKIIDMPNVHSMARMIEAEDGHSKGGGFWKAVKHVAKKAHHLYRMGHAALGLANKFKDPLLETSLLSPYKDVINSAFDTMNAMDEVVNPMVESTMKAVNGDESERQKLKEIALQSVENTARQYVPASGAYIDAAKSVREAYNTVQTHKKKYTKRELRQMEADQQNIPSEAV